MTSGVMYRRRELVDTQDDISQKAEAQTHWDIFGALKAKALAKPLPVTLAQRRCKTLDETNYYAVEEAMANRLGDTSAM